MKIAVQGVGTAEALAECFGRHPDFMPSVFVAEEFGHEFAAVVGHDGRPTQTKVFIPQSTRGRGVLAPVLRSHGYEVFSVDLYHTRELSLSDELRGLVGHLDPTTTAFVFMSPSAVCATVQQLAQHRALLEEAAIISVGPITSQAVRSAGLVVTAEAASHSEQGVVELLKP
jgi:uroporphyrinogen-III synthase